MQFVIAGAGGFGREVYGWLVDYARANLGVENQDWSIRGFLDDAPDPLGGFEGFPSVIGTIEGYRSSPDERVVVAVGNPSVRRKIVRHLTTAKAHFFTLIHPSAMVFSTATIGQGCILGPFTLVSDHVTFGDFVSLNAYAATGHDVRVGDFTELCPRVTVSGACCLGESVFLGSNVATAPRVSIGDRARVAACSSVMRDVSAYSFVQGVPGKECRNFFPVESD